jgi:hypothetical protein
MQEASANPFWVTLLCVARCLVPLVLIFGVSYLFKRLGLIAEPPPTPAEQNNEDNNHQDPDKGGLAHGKA